MPGKSFFAFISGLQKVLLTLGIGILIVLPIMLAYTEYVSDGWYTVLFGVSLVAVFLVMSIRPLADLMPGVAWIRPLVILRKGFGVLSASIIVAIMLSRFMTDGFGYVADFFAPQHWSVLNGTVLAPLGDLSALILLVTSNSFSKRVLGTNWKRIQKLAYVYFYSGALYEYLFLGQELALAAALVVTALVFGAYLRNHSTFVASVLA